jgi:cytochrome P450
VTAIDVYYDPYDYTIDADPYPVWARLREEAPLYFNEQHGFYALSRYDDVLNGLLDNDTFISGHGIVLEMITDEPFPIPMMIMMDPPQHTRLRKLVSRAFTPRRISDLETHIRQICAELLDPLVGEREFDLIDRFAGLLPPTVILALLGFPAELAGEWRKHIDASMNLEEGQTPETLAAARGLRNRDIVNTSSGELKSVVFEMLPDLIEQRRKDPTDDLLSGLVHAEIDEDGERRTLTTEEIYAFVQLISTAGSETVVRLLGFAAVTLNKFPDQRELLVANRGLIANAVEETLRYEAPSPIQSRYVAKDVELYGTLVKRGSKMALLNGSADRDPRHFADPDRYDVRREIDRHLAFGYGPHFCIGAALARLEGRVAIDELIQRFPTWDIDESRLERIHTSTVRGFTSVPFITA